MSVRKFYLQNASGERYGLNGERGAYLTEPEGLGYEMAPVYADLGRGFYATLDDESEPQGSLAATLVFDRPAYANYRAFVDWLAAAGSLLLIYCPYGTAEYQKAVRVQFIQKGELDKTRLLHVPFGLTATTPWRRPVPTEISLDTGDDRPQPRYPGRYPGRYGGDAAGSMTARIAPAGHLPGAVLLRYRGGITDPEIRLSGADSGAVYGICRLTGCTIPASDTLELSTLQEDAHVVRIAADGSVVDLTPYLDLSQDPYLRLPTDEGAILTVQSDAAFSGSAELLVYSYYRSV